MKKLTKKNLDELAKVMPVLSETEQRSYVGGGSGLTPPSDPPSGWYGSYYIGPTSDSVLQTMPTPIHAADYIAQQHDIEYKNLGLNGVSGTFSPKSRDADERLIQRCNTLIEYYELGIRTYWGYTINEQAYNAAKKMKTYFMAEQGITGFFQGN